MHHMTMIGRAVRRVRARIGYLRGERRVSWADAVTASELAELPDDELREMVHRIRLEMAYKWPHLYAPDGTYRGPTAADG
jgi:hypothetical protein